MRRIRFARSVSMKKDITATIIIILVRPVTPAKPRSHTMFCRASREKG